MATANPMKSYRRYKGGRPKSAVKNLFRVILALILVGVLAFCVLLGIVLTGSHDDVNGKPQAMVVLGYQLLPSGEPSVLLKDRLNEALTYLEAYPEMSVVVSGGKGSEEVCSEAQAMKDYLVSCGLPEERILLEERATSTYENLIYSIELLESEGYDAADGIVIVSNGFHLARTKMLWNRIYGNSDNLSTLSAPCSHLGSMLWMHVREPLVLAKDFLVRR